jgi:hypothetical protein
MSDELVRLHMSSPRLSLTFLMFLFTLKGQCHEMVIEMSPMEK